MTEAALVYEPLTGSDIRLIEILPGSWDDTLACGLERTPLRGLNEPQYVALSYAWGDPLDTVNITVNGHTHTVTRSLYTALRRLRHSAMQLTLKPLRIWVDALCINQADAQEKAHQIPRMKEIYGFTTQVLAWLGENPPEDDALLLHATDGHSNKALAVLQRSFYGNKLRLHLLRQPGCIEAVERLLLRPWFTRVWVIQEVTLPRGRAKVILLAGQHQYSLEHMDKLYWAVDCARSLPHPVTGATRLCQHLNDEEEQFERLDMAKAKTNSATTFSVRFAKVQASLKGLHASVKHDHLYAILGLCHSLPDPCLVPDYGKDYSEVYQTYARFLVEATGDLSVLMREARELGAASVPSWVPDFSSSSILSEHHLSQDGVYSDHPTFSSDGTKMHLLAVQLGRCVSVPCGSRQHVYCALTLDVQKITCRWRHNPADGVDIYADQADVSAKQGDIIVVPQGLESYNRALVLRKAASNTGEDEFLLVATCTVHDRTTGVEENGLQANVRGITDEVEGQMFTIL